MSSNPRTNYNNAVKKTQKKCFISGVNSPQAENAHIIPLNTLIEIGYKEHAENGHNNLMLSKNLHATFELENNIPTWTFERISEIGLKYTKYKLIILSKPCFLEEQEYENDIFKIDSFKVPYLELHYGICCNLYKIEKYEKFHLYNLSQKGMLFINMFQKYLKHINKTPDNKRKPEKSKSKKQKKIKLNNGCIDKEDQQYEVKNILKDKYDRLNEIQLYLIEWVGTDKKGRKWKNTWEPEDNINKDLIVKYLKS